MAYVPAIIGMCAIIYLLYVRRRESLVYRLFLVMLLLVVAWLFSQMLSFFVDDDLSLTLLRLSVAFSCLAMPMFVVFSTVFSLNLSHMSRRLYVFASVLFVPSVIFALLSLSPFMITGVFNEGIHQHIETTYIYEMQGYYSMIYSALAIATLIRNLMDHSFGGERRAQQLLIIGFCFPLAVNGLFYFIFPVDILLAQFLLPITFFVTALVITYAIVKHKLFDVRAAAVRTLAYILSLGALAAIYFASAYLASVVFFQGNTTTGISFSPVNIAMALILAFIFQPIKRFFDRVTDSIFFRDRYDSDDFIARLNETLASTLDLRNLLVRASTEIGSTMKAEHAFLYVRYNHTHKVMAGTKRYSALPTKDVEYLNRYVLERDGDVIVAELLPERHQVRRILNSHKTAILMALTRKGKVIGYLGLGEQRSSGYTDRDVRVLKTIADGLVIAIQNALSVQEVKDVNAHLEQRIDAATAELRTSNERLKKLDATKDEFISMASHQLRTPLTSIKGYISMVLEGDTGKVNPQTTKLLEEAFISSERMVGLIHDFLNVSRIQTGKFMLEKEPLDLVKIVDEEVNSLVLTAQSRGLELQLSTKLKKLVVELDQTKMRQVIMNFIDNALYYSPSEKKVTVTLATRGDRIEFRVKDEGIGVPKKEQAELFKKFYRASNARIRRPDGTGVGLFLAKKVIASHNGGVIFESTEGKGSTFGFWLPMPADDKVKTSRK